MSGRWFTGALRRDRHRREAGAARRAIRSVLGTQRRGAQDRRRRRSAVKIFGANLPADAQGRRHRRSARASRSRASSASTPDEIAIEVDVAADAPDRPARSSRSPARSSRRRSSSTTRIDGIKVLPQAGHGARRRRRCSRSNCSSSRPLAIAQRPGRQAGHRDDLQPRHGRREVVARGIHRHVRRRRHCSSSARWIDKGLFTPNVDGPNPKRSGNRNNVGDVWVVAELIDRTGAGNAKPLRARAHLLVTVPVYMNWFNTRRALNDPARRHANIIGSRPPGKPFVYLVPSAAIFALDDAADDVLRTLGTAPASRDELVAELSARATTPSSSADTISELARVRAIGELGRRGRAPPPKMLPLTPFPLTTMVLNVTNQCNLSCTYCYEYGEDKIVDTENGKKPKFMSEETARQSVEFMLKESGDNKVAHLTFFGGETLLNFPVLKKTIAYAQRARRRARQGRRLQPHDQRHAAASPEIIEFLAENDVGVTISIDGPREVQDKFRVFHNGTGSYDVVAPKIKELLKRHRTPADRRARHADLGHARHQAHLPAPHRGDRLLGSRLRAGDDLAGARPRDLATQGYDDDARAVPRAGRRVPRGVGRRTGITASRTSRRRSRRFTRAMSKAYPVRRRARPDGRRDRRRRRAVPPVRRLRRAQARHGARRHRSRRRSTRSSRSTTSTNKTDCSTCWARPLCSGGCYHEAHTRYGDDDAGRTCTTATGSAAGPTSACRSTASCRSATRPSSRSSIATDAGRSERQLRRPT